jgi:hypothetical protein
VVYGASICNFIGHNSMEFFGVKKDIHILRHSAVSDLRQ